MRLSLQSLPRTPSLHVFYPVPLVFPGYRSHNPGEPDGRHAGTGLPDIPGTTSFLPMPGRLDLIQAGPVPTGSYGPAGKSWTHNNVGLT